MDNLHLLIQHFNVTDLAVCLLKRNEDHVPSFTSFMFCLFFACAIRITEHIFYSLGVYLQHLLCTPSMVQYIHVKTPSISTSVTSKLRVSRTSIILLKALPKCVAKPSSPVGSKTIFDTIRRSVPCIILLFQLVLIRSIH